MHIYENVKHIVKKKKFFETKHNPFLHIRRIVPLIAQKVEQGTVE